VPWLVTFDDHEVDNDYAGDQPWRPDPQLKRANPHMQFADSAHRGYILLELTPQACVAQLRVLDNAADPDAAVSTLARFEIRANRPGAVRR
jgi:alkaline phosphatase D